MSELGMLVCITLLPGLKKAFLGQCAMCLMQKYNSLLVGMDFGVQDKNPNVCFKLKHDCTWNKFWTFYYTFLFSFYEVSNFYFRCLRKSKLISARFFAVRNQKPKPFFEFMPFCVWCRGLAVHYRELAVHRTGVHCSGLAVHWTGLAAHWTGLAVHPTGLGVH